MKKIVKFLLSIAIPLIIGFLSSFFTRNSISDWYVSINKPSFNPPNAIFGPVWTILYLMIGISLYLVWTSKANLTLKKKAYIAFSIQLFLNFMWSIIFFGMTLPQIAFFEIILLWLFILWNIIIVYKISKSAAYLLVPYWLWVSFASVLNYAIWTLN